MAHTETAASRFRGRLAAALVISVAILVSEVVAGIITHSLALLADAGHVFADVSGIGASLATIWIANRAPTSERSYGLYRLEIVAATANALLLLVVSLAVLWEATRRLFAPPQIQPGLMISVAVLAWPRTWCHYGCSPAGVRKASQ